MSQDNVPTPAPRPKDLLGEDGSFTALYPQKSSLQTMLCHFSFNDLGRHWEETIHHSSYPTINILIIQNTQTVFKDAWAVSFWKDSSYTNFKTKVTLVLGSKC